MSLLLAMEERLFWGTFWMNDRRINQHFEGAERGLSGHHIKALVENAEAEIAAFANRLFAQGHPPFEVFGAALRLFAAFATDKRAVSTTWPQIARDILERELLRADEAVTSYLTAKAERSGRPLLGTGRAPSVKSSHPPPDEAILAKADEMKRRGLSSYKIAQQMRLESGFEAVPTTLVRDLIKGRYARGRPKRPS